MFCRAAATAALVLSLGGCATAHSVDHAQTASQTFYSGVRLNIAALQEDQRSLDVFARRNVYPPRYPLLDLPFSLIGDTVMLGLVYGFCLGGLTCGINAAYTR